MPSTDIIASASTKDTSSPQPRASNHVPTALLAQYAMVPAKNAASAPADGSAASPSAMLRAKPASLSATSGITRPSVASTSRPTVSGDSAIATSTASTTNNPTLAINPSERSR